VRVAIIGYYRNSNAGDDRILWVFQRLFQNHEITVFSGIHEAIRNKEDLDKHDLAILGGGGIIVRDMNSVAGFIRDIKPKLLVLGVSVEAVHRDNIDFIRAMLDKAEVIYVRDKASKERLRSHSKVLVGPDLTFLYPFSPTGEETISERSGVCGINIRPWYPLNVEFRGKIHRLVTIVERHVPWLWNLCLGVIPVRKWKPQRVVLSLQKRFDTVVPIPMWTKPGVKNDVLEMSKWFTEVPRKFSIELIRNCGQVVGMRLHFAIFACQVGVPFVSLAYQPKNYGFCESVSEAIGFDPCVSIFDTGKLWEKIDYIHRNRKWLHNALIDFTREQQRVAWSIVRDIL